MDDSSPAAKRRYGHLSSWAVLGLVLLVLAFCNVPGQAVKRIRYEVGFPFYVESQLEHGWPLTYLIRARGPDSDMPFTSKQGPPPKRTVLDCFALWRDGEVFHPGSLFANGCVTLIAAFGAAAAFEAWRRQRSRLWHFHLRDAFAATLLVALATAWYVRERQRNQAEEAILFPPHGANGGLTLQSNQAGGFTWLRVCCGHESFQFLDRPFAVAVWGGDDWSQLGKLNSVRHVNAQIGGTTEEMAHLAKMPRLEALSLDPTLDDATSDAGDAELPPLPQLRGLYLTQPARRCRRLDRLTSLEALRITEGCIDDEVLREISRLPNLRELSLNGLKASADLSFLPLLPRLSALDLYAGEVSGASLKSIGECSRLKYLGFKMARVDGDGIRHLSGLAHLETLQLVYTDVTSADLAPLATLKRLRELDLTATKVVGDLRFIAALENLEVVKLYSTRVSGAALESFVGLKRLHTLDLGYTSVGKQGSANLQRMKQLKWLRVSNFDQKELAELQAALPECDILRH